MLARRVGSWWVNPAARSKAALTCSRKLVPTDMGDLLWGQEEGRCSFLAVDGAERQGTPNALTPEGERPWRLRYQVTLWGFLGWVALVVLLFLL